MAHIQTSSTVSFAINGEAVTVERPDPAARLADLLRSPSIGLTGTKVACGEAGCGACTVLLSVIDHVTGDTVWRPVNSCLHPVAQLDGAAVVTVEGLGSVAHGLHPIQRAIVQENGTQCGFCTPGFVMSMAGLLARQSAPTAQQIEDHFDGNLCRCTGYRPILDAMHRFDDAVGVPLPSAPAPLPTATSFATTGRGRTWRAATDLEHLLELRASWPASRLVVGNTSTGIYPAEAGAATELIDVSKVPELHHLEQVADGVLIGAGITLTETMDFLDQVIAEQPTDATVGLAEFRRHLDMVANEQVRSVATIGGNLAMTRDHVDADEPFPSDVVLMLMALDATVTVADGPHGGAVRVGDLARAPGGVLVDVFVPWSRPGAHVRTYKVRRRPQNAHALVNAAVVVGVDGATVTSARIVVGGLAGWPVLVDDAAVPLRGHEFDEARIRSSVQSARRVLADAVVPMPSAGVSDDYRLDAAVGLIMEGLVSIASAVDPSAVPDRWVSAGERPSRPISTGSASFVTVTGPDPVGEPVPLVSAAAQATGETRYTHDRPFPPRTLHASFVYSRARNARFDYSPFGDLAALEGELRRRDPAVVGVVTVDDIPAGGRQTMGFGNDDPVFAHRTVTAYGTPIMLVLATSDGAAHDAAEFVMQHGIHYEHLSPVISTIDEALSVPDGRFADEGHLQHINHIVRPGSDRVWLAQPSPSPERVLVTGVQRTGHQMHFYMETQSTLVVPEDPGIYTVWASTQDPASAQHAVAEVLGIQANAVSVRVSRLGGGYGGKETRPGLFVAAAAVAAHRFRRPVRLVLDRHTDGRMMGGRHPFQGEYWLQGAPDGTITDWRIDFYADGGNTYDVTFPVSDLVMLSADGAYHVPTFGANAVCCRTNRATNTAMRSFGVIQGSLIGEDAIEQFAHAIGMLPEDVRERNLYADAGQAGLQSTPYGQELRYSVMRDVWSRLRTSAEFDERAAAARRFNETNRWRKQGLAMIPLKYGISYTFLTGNQGGATVNVNALDGTVLVSTGGVEMGQGLATKLAQIAAEGLGISLDRIRVAETATDAVPNASSTGASTGTDLNGGAVKVACDELRERLRSWCSEHAASLKCDWRNHWSASWRDVVSAAYLDRLDLSAQALYSSPGLSEVSDHTPLGTPFYYFTYSAACSEVEIDVLTGDVTVLRSDILFDAGRSLNPLLDVGQIRGGFVQGLGNVTCEQTYYAADGRPYTDGTWQYKIPDSKTIPVDFRVALYTYERTNPHTHEPIDPYGIQSSKSTGEPPLVLANTVFFAIKRAILAARADAGITDWFELPSPATPDRVRAACAVDVFRAAEPSDTAEGQG